MKMIARYICVMVLAVCCQCADAQRPGVSPDSLPAKVGNSNVNDNDNLNVNANLNPNDNLNDNPNGEVGVEVPPTWEQMVQARLDELVGGRLGETSQIGLMVWDLTADSCLYRYGERQRLRPASTLKVLTAITALDLLGTDYRFATELRSKGAVVVNQDSTRTFRGDFYCVGGFDPKFGSGDMTAFAAAIREMGVDSIIGNIVADRSFKDKKLLGEGWCWDDDNPTLSSLLVGRKDTFAETLRKQVQGQGKTVAWVGTSDGVAPAGTVLMRRVEHTMRDILKPMMKNSDNLCAEAMFYQIAHRRKGMNASAADARQQIYDTMRKAGLNTSAYYIADGSGLSLYTYVTPQAEVMMLRYAYGKPDVFDALSSALPVAGVDGTLAGRMQGKATRGNVRAKTGTVTGVSSLAGYCRGGNGHQLCFSIINQGIQKSSEGRTFQDAVCGVLCR